MAVDVAFNGDSDLRIGIIRETQRRSSGRIMGMQDKSRRWGIGAVLLGATGMAAACLTIALLSPAQAQFWSPFGAPRRPPAPIQQQPPPQYQQQQQYNPFGGFLGPQEIPRPPAP